MLDFPKDLNEISEKILGENLDFKIYKVLIEGKYYAIKRTFP